MRRQIPQEGPCKTTANLYRRDFSPFTKGPIAIYSSKCTLDQREYLDFLRTDRLGLMIPCTAPMCCHGSPIREGMYEGQVMHETVTHVHLTSELLASQTHLLGMPWFLNV